ncbi:Trichohyalin, putative [Eimeria acervulina]|uniref:Trichohyalin, putative n=1 Tax=Eimeria acervulina TaxID=5801 RepID=U6GSW8_EIMAC|nr:Trichohyalin, putative [Eimeria acervulina]CDI83351.1 Trichohyalin, putative [Eimeria acervulina]
MKKLFSRSTGKPQENSGDGTKGPNRAGSMPVHRWQPSQQDSLSSEAPYTKDAETASSLPSTHRGPLVGKVIFLCKSYEPAGWANLRRGGEARAGSAAKTRYGTAGRKGKLRHPPQPKYLEQVVSMEDKLKSSTDAIQRLNEHIADLRKLLATKDKEVEELRYELEYLRKEKAEARELAVTETEKLAKANAKIEELVDRLQASEGQRNSFLQLGSPEELASLAARNSELLSQLAEKEEAVLSLRRQMTEMQEHAEVRL